MWQILFRTVTFLCLVKGRDAIFLTPDDRSDADKFAGILNEILETSRCKDVLLLLRDSPLDERADDILGKVSATVIRRVPSLYVNANRTEAQLHVSSDAMSRDLAVYIHVAERGPDVVEGKLIATDMSRFIHERVRPKVLVLMILDRPCRDLATLFREAWSRKILDMIVVEYVKSARANGLYSSMIVHRFDPFTGALSSEPCSLNTVWFTNEFPNMRAHPLVYAISRRPPYTDIVPDSAGRMRTIKGVDQMAVRTLAEKMNFTAVPKIILEPVYYSTMPNGTRYGIALNLTSGKYDAVLNTIPMFLYQMHPHIQFTDAVLVENWCFVVPRILVPRSFVNGAGFLLFLVSFTIVGIFWLCSRLMKFDPERWHPLRIVGIMLDRSFPPAPARVHERIVFLSIFAACSRYSTTLFAELTSTSLQSDHYAEYDRLQDLMNSDLTLTMHMKMLDIIVQHNSPLEHYVRTSHKRIANVTLMDTCLADLLMYRNVSCFMERDWAKLAAVNNMRGGQTMLKITKLCYLSPPSGNVFPKGSPYLRRFNDLLLMLAEAGIRDKWQRDFLRNETRETSMEMIRNQRTDSVYVSVLNPLFYVLITGYLLSAFVLVGELIWKRVNLRCLGNYRVKEQHNSR